MTVRKIEAVLALVPNAEVSVHGNDLVTWYDPKVAPVTEEQIQAKLLELQAAYDAQAYARSRKAEYPSIEELVVALYDTDDKAAVEAKRSAVKAKYPKPS